MGLVCAMVCFAAAIFAILIRGSVSERPKVFASKANVG